MGIKLKLMKSRVESNKNFFKNTMSERGYKFLNVFSANFQKWSKYFIGSINKVFAHLFFKNKKGHNFDFLFFRRKSFKSHISSQAR
jgi:hypothetical protein